MAEIHEEKTNRLADSNSPYLLQHARNPVDWHPWSPEVFLKAESEDKPVFLSIGYSTCHWCHVMEKESFSDPEVAALLNETFVCVKVDREKRPDLEQDRGRAGPRHSPTDPQDHAHGRDLRSHGIWSSPLLHRRAVVFAPHFEKMLYDQALAVLTYAEAFCATGEGQLRKAGEEILTYVLRDLQSPEGGFYSAEDGDSEGEEGKFYTWTAGELDEILDEEEVLVVREVYNTSDGGNFLTESGQPTGRNILYLSPDVDDLPGRLGMNTGQLDGTPKRIREKLMAARSVRIRPLRDDKIMTDWNGLVIAALAKTAGAFEVDSYADAAEKALEFILGNATAETGHLSHIRYDGGETIPAFLDDYAYLLWGILELHQFTYRADLLTVALRLASEMVDLLGDTENGGFFLTRQETDPSLVRQKPSFDGAMPSGNAVAAMNLLRLGRLTARRDLEEEGHKTFRAFGAEMGSNPAGFTHMISALDMAQHGTAEVVIVGDPDKGDTKRFVLALQRSYLPAVTVVVVNPETPDPAIRKLIPYASDMKTVDGRAAAYVYRDFACLTPTTDPEEMLRSLLEMKVP